MMDVEKLKQKILDLAIRGKLVPQDPNDEPASVLIEKIKAEKAKLVKEGKIKASKEESYIFKGSDNFYYEKKGNKTTCVQDEIPFEIPSTWQWTRLNNVGEIIGGGTPSTANIKYWDKGDIVWITPAYMSRLDTPFINDSDRKITTEGLQHSSAKLMPAGSIIMSSRAPIGYLAINSVPACTSQGCKSLVPYIAETNMYILNAIKASIGRVIESSKGTTFDEISGTQFGNILIPLPPIAEQTKINKLISKAFEVLTKIAENNQLISRYTKSVKGKILELFFGENSSYKSYYKKRLKIKDICKVISSNKKEIKAKDVKEKGNYPVVSQSKNLIDGFSDDKDKLINAYPVVIFGDHTRVVKYVDFNFIAGADGTKILAANKTSSKYLYYSVLYAAGIIDDRGYNRHFSFLKEVDVPLMDKEKEKNMIAIIDGIFKKLDLLNAI